MIRTCGPIQPVDVNIIVMIIVIVRLLQRVETQSRYDPRLMMVDGVLTVFLTFV